MTCVLPTAGKYSVQNIGFLVDLGAQDTTLHRGLLRAHTSRARAETVLALAEESQVLPAASIL